MNRNKHIKPNYKKDVFTCSYCNAITNQEKTDYHLSVNCGGFNAVKSTLCKNPSCKQDCLWLIKQKLVNINGCSRYRNTSSREKLIFPVKKLGEPPSEDMPKDVKEIYEEARGVVAESPRAAAALLRVALERLCTRLGENEGTLYQRIVNLKSKGLSESAIKNLHTVRITANEGGSHAGQIDLTNKDGPDIVNKLFFIINRIIEKTITDPREEEKMFKSLPKNKTRNLK